MGKWSIAWDVVQDARGTCGMFMFILEESIQTAGMACYLLQKEGKWQELLELATDALDNLIAPALDFVNLYGTIAAPLHSAYIAFYQTAQKTFTTYQTIARSHLLQG